MKQITIITGLVALILLLLVGTLVLIFMHPETATLVEVPAQIITNG